MSIINVSNYSLQKETKMNKNVEIFIKRTDRVLYDFTCVFFFFHKGLWRKSFLFFFFPPLMVSMTRVHHACPETRLIGSAIFGGSTLRKAFAASSLQLPLAGLPCKGEFRRVAHLLRPLRSLRTRAPSGFCFRPRNNRHFEFMILRDCGARTPKNLGR